jgi:benzoate/toluate 1,2-dioxygenase subunit beta
MTVDRQQVETFLYLEARRMDEHAYDDWLALWADDALYWVPANRDDIDPEREVSIVYADRPRLEDRIARLKSGAAYAQDPPSRMRRIVSNVEVEEEADGEIIVYANFLLTELRRHRQTMFAGRTIHKLRPEQGSFKIVSKKVELLNNDEVIDNLSFLI